MSKEDKEFRIRIKRDQLNLLIQCLAKHLKEEFDSFEDSDFKDHLKLLQRLVATYVGDKGRPEEWGIYWRSPFIKEEAENKINRLLKKMNP